MRILTDITGRTSAQLILSLRRNFVFSIFLFLFTIITLTRIMDGGQNDPGRILRLGIIMIVYLLICLSFFRVWRELSRRIPEK